MFPRSRATQARALPAPPLTAAPLPRGYIDTGDIMAATPGETRVDLRQREVVKALRTKAEPLGFAAGRTPTLPAPARTVYVTLNRPDGLRQANWRQLLNLVRSSWPKPWQVQEFATSHEAEFPAVSWVLLVPADQVVSTQDRLLEAIEHLPWTEIIWAEATPRTLRHRPEV